MENSPVVAKNRIAKYLDYEVEVGNDETPEQVKTNLAEMPCPPKSDVPPKN